MFRGANYLSVFDRPQRDALAMLFLGLWGQGHAVNGIFWGLWLLPFWSPGDAIGLPAPDPGRSADP